MRANLCFITLLLCFPTKPVKFFAAPLQPANISPANGQNNFSGNQISFTVTDPDGQPMTVKLYGRKKTSAGQTDFTLIGLPDTQYYTEEPQGGPNGVRQQASNAIFKAQTQWIADNRTNRNIVFVSHLGDCSQNGNAFEVEWKRADTAIKKIESPNVPLADGIPYSICVGNHDQGNASGNPTAPTTFYNQYFGEARFSGRSYYGGHYGSNNDNHYELFSVGGIDFIHISLEFNNNSGATNQAVLLDVLNWADNLLKTYPNRKGIVASHWILEIGTNAPFGGPGAQIYNQLKDNPNFMLMLCGHQHGEGRRSDVLNNGGTIHTLLSDYQARTNGGNGWLRIMEFSPANNQVRIKTYSPTLNQFETDADSEFNLAMDLSPSFRTVGTSNSAPSGSTVNFTWSGLLPATEYEWYATLDDGTSMTTSSVFSFTTSGALPVTLKDIRAVNYTNRVKLEWSTSAEINASYFDAQHSPDGRSFTTMAQVSAAGNASDYFVYDDQPFAGTSFYRLNMVNKDGTSAYSRIVSVSRIKEGKFAVMPNPASRTEIRLITQQLPAGPARIDIYDEAGRLQLSQNRQLNRQPLIVKHRLSRGTYHIELTINNIKAAQTFIVH